MSRIDEIRERIDNLTKHPGNTCVEFEFRNHAPGDLEWLMELLDAANQAYDQEAHMSNVTVNYIAEYDSQKRLVIRIPGAKIEDAAIYANSLKLLEACELFQRVMAGGRMATMEEHTKIWNELHAKMNNVIEKARTK